MQATAERFSILKSIYIHSGTRTPILVGFEQLVDSAKKAFLKKKLSLFVTFNQRNRNLFPSKAIVPPFQLIQHSEQFSAAQVS